jgi:hypothetical protein
MIRAGDILRDGATDTEGGGGSHMAIGYSATVARCFGPQMGTVADIAIVTMNFGSGVAYLDVIADILAAWVGSGSKVIGLFLVILFVVGPLSCIREIENLKFTSLLGLCIYTLFMLITVVLFFIGVSCGGEAYAPAASSDFLVAIPIQTLAFACHTVVFPVYREFREIPGSTSTSFQHALRLTNLASQSVVIHLRLPLSSIAILVLHIIPVVIAAVLHSWIWMVKNIVLVSYGSLIPGIVLFEELLIRFWLQCWTDARRPQVQLCGFVRDRANSGLRRRYEERQDGAPHNSATKGRELR